MKIKILSILILFLFTSSFAGEIMVANTVDTELDQAAVEKIFLGKMKKWSDGTNVIITTLKSGTTHESFLTQYVNKQPMQFDNFWRQMVFTGRGKMPQSFDSEDAMLKYISANKGAVGYVSDAKAGALPANVKKITIK
jgi:ABC-type phosphate transport system substrate-binding protein